MKTKFLVVVLLAFCLGLLGCPASEKPVQQRSEAAGASLESGQSGDQLPSTGEDSSSSSPTQKPRSEGSRSR